MTTLTKAQKDTVKMKEFIKEQEAKYPKAEFNGDKFDENLKKACEQK